jgi:hypothetical protein
MKMDITKKFVVELQIKVKELEERIKKLEKVQK